MSFTAHSFCVSLGKKVVPSMSRFIIRVKDVKRRLVEGMWILRKICYYIVCNEERHCFSVEFVRFYLPGFFFGPFEKNSRTRKLKPQENNSKLKQKTQGFGKVWKNNYKYWPKQREKYTVMVAIWLKCLFFFNWNTAKVVYF